MDKVKAIETLSKNWKISFEEANILFEGIMYQENGEYDKSISLYDDALKRYPNSSKLLGALGEAYFRKKEYELAINNFNCSLSLNSLEEHAYFGLGEVYREKGNNDEQAIISYSHALKINPKYFAALNNRGLIYFKQGKYKEAIDDYNNVLRNDPSEAGIASSYHNRGDVYVKQENYDIAIADFTKSLKAEPSNPDVFFKRGYAYAKIGNHDLAIEDLSKAIHLDNSKLGFFFNRSRSLTSIGKYQEALSDLTHILQFDLPNDPPKDLSDPSTSLTKIGMLLNRGSIYRLLKYYDKAINDYSEIINLAPDYAQAFNNRGNIYAQKGLHHEALNDYNEAIRLDQNYHEAYNNRGSEYARIGEYDAAIIDFNKVIELNGSGSGITYLLRGGVFETKGLLSEALNDYSKSIEIDDKDSDAYFLRGNLYFNTEQYDNAIKDFNIILGLLPKIGGVPNIHKITKKMLQKANEMKHK